MVNIPNLLLVTPIELLSDSGSLWGAINVVYIFITVGKGGEESEGGETWQCCYSSLLDMHVTVVYICFLLHLSVREENDYCSTSLSVGWILHTFLMGNVERFRISWWKFAFERWKSLQTIFSSLLILHAWEHSNFKSSESHSIPWTVNISVPPPHSSVYILRKSSLFSSFTYLPTILLLSAEVFSSTEVNDVESLMLDLS